MKRLFVMMIILGMFITLSSCAEAKQMSDQQKKAIVIGSMNYVLINTQLSGLPKQKVFSINEKMLKYQSFGSVQKTSQDGIKLTMWPIKVKGSGIVLVYGMMNIQQKYNVVVEYKVYGFFDETNDLKFETSDIKLISSNQIN